VAHARVAALPGAMVYNEERQQQTAGLEHRGARMTRLQIIILKLGAAAKGLESILYEVRPVFFLVFGLAAIFLTDRNLVEILFGVILIFISGYALKARVEFRKTQPSK
jgi:hypothetical protein